MLKRFRQFYVKGLRRRANWVEKHPWLIVFPIVAAALRTHRLWYGAPAKEPEFPAYKTWMDEHVFSPLRDIVSTKSKARIETVKATNDLVEFALKSKIDRLNAQDVGPGMPDHIRERLGRLADKIPDGVRPDITESLADLLRKPGSY